MSSVVSILIPCYNAEAWVGGAVESALQQAGLEKEVIVADDGSSDGSLRVLQQFSDRIRILPLPHSGGNATRNALLGAANGKWLKFLDADDFLLPDQLRSQVEFAEEEAGWTDIVYGPYFLQDEVRQSRALVQIDREASAESVYIRWGALQTTALLFRRESIQRAGGWNEAQSCCQEHELMLRCFLAGMRFRCCLEPSSVYRVHGTGTVSRKKPLRTVLERAKLTDRMEDLLAQRWNLEGEHKQALFAARLEMARSCWSVDRPSARMLATKALKFGAFPVTDSPALPRHYLTALRYLGFDGAEHIAELLRWLRMW